MKERPTRRRAGRPGPPSGGWRATRWKRPDEALAESRFRGAAYHLSDCQLLEDRPVEDVPQQL